MATFNDVMKNVVVTGLGTLGNAGTAMGLLLDIFWPKSGGGDENAGAYSLTEADVIQITNEEIKDYIMNKRLNEINGYRENLEKYYVDSNLDKEKHEALISADKKMNILKNQIQGDEDKYKTHMLETTLLLAQLHLQVLRDIYIYGKGLLLTYSDEAKNWTDKQWLEQVADWRSDIEDNIQDYQVLLGAQFFLWRKWREDQVEVNAYENFREKPHTVPDITTGTTVRYYKHYTAHGQLTDNVEPQNNKSWSSGEAEAAEVKWGDDYYHSTVVGAKNYITSTEVARKAAIVAPVFYFSNKYLNGKLIADAAGQFFNGRKMSHQPGLAANVIAVGPVNCSTVGLQTRARSDIDPVHKDDYKGEDIVGFRGYAGSAFESIQLLYENHDGIQYGGTGGKEVVDSIPKGKYINIVHLFLSGEGAGDDNSISGIQFQCIDELLKEVKATERHHFELFLPFKYNADDPMQFKLRKIDFNQLDEGKPKLYGPNGMFFYFELVPNIKE